jgi:alpha-tubulin suppressor-like RCC1 family protein
MPIAQVVVAAGGAQTMCLTPEGSIYCWGYGGSGQLGLGDNDSRPAPSRVQGELQKKVVIQLAVGPGHTACVTKGGAVYCWGAGYCGQLGLGDENDKLAPALVDTGGIWDTSVTQICCGSYHTTCLADSGEVFAWGRGSSGQLGLGDTNGRPEPTLVAAAGKSVSKVGAGPDHSLCLQYCLVCHLE